jgi:hypothetical protein
MPYKSEVASRDFVNHGALQNRKIATAHQDEKSTERTKTIFFSPPAGGEKELEPVQR